MRRCAVIFDDADLFRHVLWAFFDQRGYEFTFPYPDLGPLHVASECPCPHNTSCSDIIISDVDMLGKNGIDFIEKLIDKGCRQKHLALMSGAFTAPGRERASRLGCAIFEKPLDMDAFTAWVEAEEKSIPLERVLFDWKA